MNSIEKLTQIFSQFPGIGPRQAKRFVYFLLTKNNALLEEFTKELGNLKKDIVMCDECKRFFDTSNKPESVTNLCKICIDPKRDKDVLMVVQRDVDLEVVEKNSNFSGYYFVLGGSVPVLDKEPEKKIRIRELVSHIKNKSEIKEIIIATNWNPEGENTFDYVKKILEDTLQQAQGTQTRDIKISSLGKGLSMGTELEYTDSETMKNALKNRG